MLPRGLDAGARREEEALLRRLQNTADALSGSGEGTCGPNRLDVAYA